MFKKIFNYLFPSCENDPLYKVLYDHPDLVKIADKGTVFANREILYQSEQYKQNTRKIKLVLDK